MTNHPKTLQEALEMADKKFKSASDFCSCMEGDMFDRFPEAMSDVKELLTTIWHAGRESVVEELIAIAEGMKGTSFDHSTSPKSIDYSYDAAITDVITKLSELKENKCPHCQFEGGKHQYECPNYVPIDWDKVYKQNPTK